MFSGFMTHAWIVATLLGLLAGSVGFFVVLRGEAFAAHAIPNGAFAGAAGASLVGASSLLGLGVFSLLSTFLITGLRRRGRADVATALVLMLMLALGAAFLSQSTEYEPEIFSLLFGEILGVTSSQLIPVLLVTLVSLVAVAALFRPLLLSSLSRDLALVGGVRLGALDFAFLVLVAATTTVTVPVVGAFLLFSLMIGPPAAARTWSNSPLRALVMGVVIAEVTVWVALASAYTTNWPVGFFVGVVSAGWFALARAHRWWRRARVVPSRGRVDATAAS